MVGAVVEEVVKRWVSPKSVCEHWDCIVLAIAGPRDTRSHIELFV